MSEHREKLADVDRQIADAVGQREDLIQRIANLSPYSPEKDEAVRHRDALNEVLVSLRRYRRSLEML
jgi:Lon protease-like protein